MSDPAGQGTGEPSIQVSFSITELISIGLAGAMLWFLASVWQLPGALFGALSPMLGAVITAMIKAYLSERAIRGARLPVLLGILTSAWWLGSRSPELRNSILLAGLRAGIISSIIGVSTIIVVEAIAGEKISCLIRAECNPPPPGGSDHPETTMLQ